MDSIFAWIDAHQVGIIMYSIIAFGFAVLDVLRRIDGQLDAIRSALLHQNGS